MVRKVNKLVVDGEEYFEKYFTSQISDKRRNKIISDHEAVYIVPHDDYRRKPISTQKQLELGIEGQKKAYFEGISNARSEGRRSGATEGLSINKQVRQKSSEKRFHKMTSRVTGKSFYVDPERMRAERLKKKCENHFKIIENYEIEGTPYSACPLDKSSRFKHQFYTLTYDPKLGDWTETDISEFFDRLRRYIERKVKTPVSDPWLYLGYFWVREFHKSGRVHYHFILTSPKSWNIPNIHLDKKGIWVKGMTSCGMKDKKPIRSYGYLMKYLTKEESKSSSAVSYVSQRSYGSSYIKKLVGFNSTYLSSYAKLCNIPSWLKPKVYMSVTGIPTDRLSFSDIKESYVVVKVSGGYLVNKTFYEAPWMSEGFIDQNEYDKVDKMTKEENQEMHKEITRSVFADLVLWE